MPKRVREEANEGAGSNKRPNNVDLASSIEEELLKAQALLADALQSSATSSGTSQSKSKALVASTAPVVTSNKIEKEKEKEKVNPYLLHAGTNARFDKGKTRHEKTRDKRMGMTYNISNKNSSNSNNLQRKQSRSQGSAPPTRPVTIPMMAKEREEDVNEMDNMLDDLHSSIFSSETAPPINMKKDTMPDGNVKEREDSSMMKKIVTSDKLIKPLSQVQAIVVTEDKDDFVTTSEKDIPIVEWWDMAYRKKTKKDKGDSSAEVEVDYDALSLSNSKTYTYIQHPVPIDQIKEDTPLPLILTKAERKRISKQKRMEREQERRDKEMMGLVPPREPKLKLSNYMSILANEAIADPSKVEQSVLKQVYKRAAEHELKNLENKLTPEERKAKTIQKRTASEVEKPAAVHVAVFQVKKLSNRRLQYKIYANTKDWLMTGTAVAVKGSPYNIVLIEGGPKGIKKFLRLMLHRIKYNDYPEDEEDHSKDETNNEVTFEFNASAIMKKSDDDIEDDNDMSTSTTDININNTDCKLLWKGLSTTRQFNNYRFFNASTPEGAKKYLKNKDLLHFYSLATNE
jgi:hypothetical protein